ncbi:response regulator transcription factor [Marinobacterium rhizophilum]|uniref:Helix-turn-helix transcriptional regulator n=1 Tax=Marinobacterium rhizophilum TaxID=420402 RepID=A0ABY5HLB4_9GAMM|nr:helix-turn-helix transcriptional regulator [Marinobacterium rhizophilum]UTW13186.1 helix-turn-helix transcriptional regulator [Marinobacterium rhizophilum]
MLTERESALIRLLLRGHSNQSAVDKMGISITTVKMHRQHCKGELDITSQAEKFSLFYQFLEHYAGGFFSTPAGHPFTAFFTANGRLESLPASS